MIRTGPTKIAELRDEIEKKVGELPDISKEIKQRWLEPFKVVDLRDKNAYREFYAQQGKVWEVLEYGQRMMENKPKLDKLNILLADLIYLYQNDPKLQYPSLSEKNLPELLKRLTGEEWEMDPVNKGNVVSKTGSISWLINDMVRLGFHFSEISGKADHISVQPQYAIEAIQLAIKDKKILTTIFDDLGESERKRPRA